MKTRILPLATVIMVCLLPVQLNAQVIRGFNLIYSDNIKGGHTMFGNTAVAIYSSGSGNSGTVNSTLMNRFGDYGNSKTSNITNDENNIQYLDIDADATTTRSSSADLILPAGNNTIRFARLYWGARINNKNITSNDANIRTIKLKGPGGTYTTYTAPVTQMDKYDISDNSKVYQTFIDITTLVNTLKAGTYTVADMAGSTGNMGGSGGGYFGGWTIAVVYENSTLPYSSVRVYDGYLQVYNEGSVTSRSVTLTGLNAPSGTMTASDAYLSVMAWEGDAALAASHDNPLGDYLKINNSTYSNALNPAANMWNGTISKNGAHVTTKNPNYLNQFGIDLDEVQVGGAYGITENATTVNIEFGTESDQYFPSVFAFTMKMKDPQIQLDMSVTDANGDSKVQKDEILTYVLDGYNLPTAPGHSYASDITDSLPYSVAYIRNSLKIWDYNINSWVNITDAAGDDIATFDSVTTATGKSYYIHIHIGDGAAIPDGGELQEGQHVKLQFQVTARAATSVVNTARMTGLNQLLAVTFMDDGFAALPGSQAPLAIRLVSFNGIYNGNVSQLQWQVATEINTAYYEVQRSMNGIEFETAGVIEVNGSSYETKIYTYTDRLTNTTDAMYYRLKETGMDNKSFFSNVLKLSNGINSNTLVLNGPNPFNNYVQLQSTLKVQTRIDVRIIGQNGNIVAFKNFTGQKGSNLLRIDQLERLPNAMYIIEVITTDSKQSFRVIKQ